MHSRSIVSLLAVLTHGLLSACASQGTAAQEERAPLVKLEQVGDVPAMGVQPDSGIPMQYRLTIENPFGHEVKLVSVEIQSVGDAGGYSMNRVRHPFSETIAAGEKREVNFRAWVHVLTEGEMRSVDHPVLLRGVARFEGPSGGMSRNFSARVNDTAKTKSTK